MIRIIEPHTTEEWEAYFQLRYEALRRPWHKPKGSEKDDLEDSCLHFFALENEVPLGVCRLQYNENKIAQIRFMAVNEKSRGKGIGSLLLKHCEERARKEGYTQMILQARDYAVPFYETNGYVVREKSFLLWDLIQHFLMDKPL